MEPTPTHGTRFVELTGRQFGLLKVIREDGRDRWGATMWRCQCDCGTGKRVKGASLTTGATRSCGCRVSAVAIERFTTHGMTGTDLYGRWRSMLARCELPSFADYHNYGGRGISVCDEWHSFEAFQSDMGESFRPDLTLDRVDVDGNYEPSNCRWATRAEQSRNKRTNHFVTWHGRTMVVQDWGETFGIKPNTIVHRLRRGWDVERALTKGADEAAVRAVLLELANSQEDQ